MTTTTKRKENYIVSDAEDELLIELIRNEESEYLDYLINKYKYFVRFKSNKYFLIGGEGDDLFQEGMIGLYKAIRDYKIGELMSFSSFVDLCVNRQIITAIKTATRKKHIPLNSYTSLDKNAFDDENSATLLEIIPDTFSEDPVSLMIYKETKDELEEKLTKKLSELEKKVLKLYLEGLSYVEISEELQTHIKTIDNALTRVKRKIEKYFY